MKRPIKKPVDSTPKAPSPDTTITITWGELQKLIATEREVAAAQAIIRHMQTGVASIVDSVNKQLGV